MRFKVDHLPIITYADDNNNIVIENVPDVLILWSNVSELTIVIDDALELCFFLSQLQSKLCVHTSFGF